MNPQSAVSPIPPMSLTAHAQPAVREVDSRSLLAGKPCIAIRHGDEVYWLRSTRQGKLLLTK